MATGTITTKLAPEGEAECRAALRSINAEIRLCRRELERVQAECAGQLNGLDALRAKETARGGTEGPVPSVDGCGKAAGKAASDAETLGEALRQAGEAAEQFCKARPEALSGLADTALQSGSGRAKGLMEGPAFREEALYAKVRAVEREAAGILEGAWKNIPSNAEIAARLHFEAMGEPRPATPQDVRRAVAAGVNGMRTAAGRGSGDLVIPLNINGREFARATIQDFRAENRANPEVTDDR